MALDPAFQEAAADWVTRTGVPATYRSATTGLAKNITATLEGEVTTVDEMGMTTHGMVVTALSSDISQVARGDTFHFPGKGITVHVDELLDDPGFLVRLMVSKQ